jgi:hypothetical protein
MDVLRHAESHAGVPSGPVEDEDDLFTRASTRLGSENLEFGFEERKTHAGRQVEDSPARCGVDETDEVAPGEAMLDGSNRALFVKRPDFVHQGLETDAVLIDGPQFEAAVRECSCYLPQ